MISRRARCGLHAVAYLAYRGDERPVTLAEIRQYLLTYSQQLTFSEGHISKIFNALTRPGILRAIPGRHGGYLLARPAEQVGVNEVVQALDGVPEKECCLLSIGGCDNHAYRGVFGIVQEAESRFYEILSRETAASLAHKMFQGRAPQAASVGTDGFEGSVAPKP